VSAAAIQTVKTGRFPHQAYRPACGCPSGQPKEVRNYAGHIIAPPVCSACGLGYRLDIALMPTFAKAEPTRGI
jgi:hypothetical protein